MTTLFIVAIRDRAIDSFNQPIFVRHLNEALRSFKDEMNDPKSIAAKHPEDYDLYNLGYYDQQKGKFETQEPQLIAIGKDQVIHKQQDHRDRFDEITRGAGLNAGAQ